MTRARPDRRPLITVAFLIFLTTLASNAPSPLYVIYQERFGFSALALTAVFACYAGGVMVALIVVGRLSDVIGRRPVLAPALALLGISAALFMAARGTGWLFAARSVQGLGTGALTAAATAALVDLEPNHDRRRASYITTIVFIMGAASGPLLFGAAVQYLPWPTVLPFAAEAGMVAVGLIGIKFLPETVARAPGFHWTFQRPYVPRPLIGVFTVAVVVLSVSWGAGALFAALSSSIDRDLLHVRNHALAGLVLFALYGAGGVSQLSLRHWPARRSMTVGVVTVAAGMTLTYLGLSGPSVALFLVGTVLVGGGSGIGFMGSLALVNEVAPPQRRAEVLSAWNLIGYIALSAPVVGVGLLTGVTGLQGATGIFTAAVVAVAGLAVILLARSPSRPLSRLSDDELIGLGLDPAVIAGGIRTAATETA
jgi:MFS family permease